VSPQVDTTRILKRVINWIVSVTHRKTSRLPQSIIRYLLSLPSSLIIALHLFYFFQRKPVPVVCFLTENALLLSSKTSLFSPFLCIHSQPQASHHTTFMTHIFSFLFQHLSLIICLTQGNTSWSLEGPRSTLGSLAIPSPNGYRQLISPHVRYVTYLYIPKSYGIRNPSHYLVGIDIRKTNTLFSYNPSSAHPSFAGDLQEILHFLQMR